MTKLLVKLLVGTETIFFLALIVAYLYFAYTPSYHADAKSLLDLKTTGLFSLFLFTSSFTLWLAERNQKRGKTKNLKHWLLTTIVLGLVFLAGQGTEYYRLLRQGFSVSKNVFATSFFTLTGFHGLHVGVGVLVLSILFGQFLKSNFDVYRTSLLRAASIYWHFVDVIWLIVFSVIYVIPYF